MLEINSPHLCSWKCKGNTYWNLGERQCERGLNMPYGRRIHLRKEPIGHSWLKRPNACPQRKNLFHFAQFWIMPQGSHSLSCVSHQWGAARRFCHWRVVIVLPLMHVTVLLQGLGIPYSQIALDTGSFFASPGEAFNGKPQDSLCSGLAQCTDQLRWGIDVCLG